MMRDQLDLLLDYPANIAKMLLNNYVDIGLVPVAVLPNMNEYHIISDYCIGCDGEVASVCLCSEVPITEIKKVMLDYESRTSVALCKILMQDYWNISPVLEKGFPGYQKNIRGTTAGLVIGDRALKQRNISKYVYDLGLVWKEMTGLPFVFAAWVSNKIMDDAFISAFNKATSEGFLYLEEIVADHPFDSYDLQKYYTKNIQYNLDDKKQEALKLFLKKLSAYK